MGKKEFVSRRAALKGMGSVGAFAFLGAGTVYGKSIEADIGTDGVRKAIFSKVFDTPFIDTHEHLIEEAERLKGAAHPRVNCDDWALLFSHYLNSDLISAGMKPDAVNRFLSPNVDPKDKWKILAPYWPAVKNTGYGQAVRISIEQLYGISELSQGTIGKVQAGYEKVRRKGFYKRILNELAGIESCQVNCLTGEPFKESDMPELLMQDISIVGMFAGPNINKYARPAGIKVKNLADWHKVIDWWFAKYGKYAVAVKSQNAYSRDIDYENIPAEKAEDVFKAVLEKRSVTAAEKKRLEDHLFWYSVDASRKAGLPVKLHTGYYAGTGHMPLGRLINNAGSATNLCRMSPGTKFVFMHICYPYYEELLSVAKHYANAYIDMCWAWIINPIAAKDLLKKHLVTAPANKILTFGGDYIPVEPVLGHAVIARRGIALALSELVEEGWMSSDDALELIDPIMHGNAREIFNLDEKTKILKSVKW